VQCPSAERFPRRSYSSAHVHRVLSWSPRARSDEKARLFTRLPEARSDSSPFSCAAGSFNQEDSSLARRRGQGLSGGLLQQEGWPRLRLACERRWQIRADHRSRLSLPILRHHLRREPHKLVWALQAQDSADPASRPEASPSRSYPLPTFCAQAPRRQNPAQRGNAGNLIFPRHERHRGDTAPGDFSQNSLPQHILPIARRFC